MSSGASTLFFVLVGLALLASLVVVLVRTAGRTSRRDTRREPAAQTWSAAVPWLVGLVILLVVLVGLYWLRT